ncbi:MAG TPA: hypothetical protein VN207_09455, partial [Ktedonobacteraceae bacterium]|nr:hypothetical protein [Ktedonobacteraceae bacterium]
RRQRGPAVWYHSFPNPAHSCWYSKNAKCRFHRNRRLINIANTGLPNMLSLKPYLPLRISALDLLFSAISNID